MTVLPLMVCSMVWTAQGDLGRASFSATSIAKHAKHASCATWLSQGHGAFSHDSFSPLSIIIGDPLCKSRTRPCVFLAVL